MADDDIVKVRIEARNRIELARLIKAHQVDTGCTRAEQTDEGRWIVEGFVRRETYDTMSRARRSSMGSAERLSSSDSPEMQVEMLENMSTKIPEILSRVGSGARFATSSDVRAAGSEARSASRPALPRGLGIKE